jgi:hypothetical protein
MTSLYNITKEIKCLEGINVRLKNSIIFQPVLLFVLMFYIMHLIIQEKPLMTFLYTRCKKLFKQ